MNVRHRKKQSKHIVSACCVCGRIKERNVWVTDHLGATVSRTHTYCPDCLVVEVRRNFPDSVESVLALCRAS